MANAKVQVPKVFKTYEIGEVKPMKDFEVLVGMADVVLDGKDKYMCFICQGQSGKQGAALENKFDLSYLERVAKFREKKMEEDPEGIMAAMDELAKVKPEVEEKVMEKWKEVSKNLDFKPGGSPKLEGELAEMWAKKPKPDQVDVEPLE